MTSQVVYQEPIEEAIASLETWLNNWGKSNLFTDYALSSRSLALLLLQKDPVLWQVLEQDYEQCREVEIVLTVAQNQLEYPVNLAIAQTRQQQALSLESIVLQETKKAQTSFTEKLHKLTVNPITGFPLLVVILYFGVYKFVGEFGAGELVDRIEGFFEGQINPIVDRVTAQIIPWQPLQDLIANDYRGIKTTIAMVLFIVPFAFLVGYCVNLGLTLLGVNL